MAKRAKSPPRVADWIADAMAARGVPTYGRLAAEAGLPASTISAIVRAGRQMSPKVAKRIAAALCPPDANLREFTARLFTVAGIDPQHLGPETIADRIRRTGVIRAAYVVSEPFVRTPEKGQTRPVGFAIALFDYVAAMLGARVEYEPQPLTFRDLESTLLNRRVDVVVSAVLRSFRRQQFMAFSDPFPFLRVPLSALRRKGTDLDVRTVVNWSSLVPARPDLLGLRFLLVEDEVGDEFVRTFLGGTPHRPAVERVSTLAPRELLDAFEHSGADVLVADMATCEAVESLGRGAVEPVPEHPDDQGLARMLAQKHPTGFPGLATLAMYSLGFGLPPITEGEHWQRMVNEAMRALLLEGFRPTLHLYQMYMRGLRPYMFVDDEHVRMAGVTEAFERLAHPERAGS